MGNFAIRGWSLIVRVTPRHGVSIILFILLGFVDDVLYAYESVNICTDPSGFPKIYIHISIDTHSMAYTYDIPIAIS